MRSVKMVNSGEIIRLNAGIIETLKAQRARNMKLLDKYMKSVKMESTKPGNQFMHWVTLVDPLTDAIISTKVSEYELNKRWELFTKALINIVSEDETEAGSVDEVDAVVQSLISGWMKIERDMGDVLSRYSDDMKRIIEARIAFFQRMPEKIKQIVTKGCPLCGEKSNKGNELNLCYDCVRLDEERVKELLGVDDIEYTEEADDLEDQPNYEDEDYEEPDNGEDYDNKKPGTITRVDNATLRPLPRKMIAEMYNVMRTVSQEEHSKNQKKPESKKQKGEK